MSYNLKYCSFIRIILMRLPCDYDDFVTAFRKIGYEIKRK